MMPRAHGWASLVISLFMWSLARGGPWHDVLLYVGLGVGLGVFIDVDHFVARLATRPREAMSVLMRMDTEMLVTYLSDGTSMNYPLWHGVTLGAAAVAAWLYLPFEYKATAVVVLMAHYLMDFFFDEQWTLISQQSVYGAVIGAILVASVRMFLQYI